MRVLCKCLAMAAVAAWVPGCASEDPWMYRSPGGGSGGTDGLPDADPTPPDADTQLLGQVCVIQSFDMPLVCPAVALAGNVDVTTLLTTSTPVTTVQSDVDGRFAVTTMDGSLILDVGSTTAGLHPTRSTVTNARDATPVPASVFSQALWDAMRATLLESEATGALVVYVVDQDGAPLPGATVDNKDAPVDMRLYHDDGAGSWIRDLDGTGTTGADGIALMLDSGTGTVSVTATGYQALTQNVSTTTAGVGYARFQLMRTP